MIYRIEFYSQVNCSMGFAYCGSKKDVAKVKRKFLSEYDKDERADIEARVEAHPTPKNKAEMLYLLGWWATHNDNG